MNKQEEGVETATGQIEQSCVLFSGIGDIGSFQRWLRVPGFMMATEPAPPLLDRGRLILKSYTCVAGFKVVYWGRDEKRGWLKFRSPAALGKCHCLFRSTCSLSSYGRSFYLHPERNCRLIGPIPRGTDQWQEKYNARTSVERAYSEAKGSHRLASLRVRGLSNVKIHVYLALCAQVIKRIGAAVVDRLAMPRSVPCMVKI